MSNKLTFKLKQHTPIIHFQHEQHGATLRATELKPKLDKFLIEKAFGGYLAFDRYKDYLIGYTKIEKGKIEKKLCELKEESEKINFLKKQKLAFDYKVRIHYQEDIGNLQYYYFESRIKGDDKERIARKIQSELNLPNLHLVAPSSFFANNDKRNNDEYDKIAIGILWTGIIEVEIFSFSNALLKILKTYTPQLFCIENFGMRQSKGFGSFSDEKTKESAYFEILSNNFSLVKKLDYTQENSNNVHKIIASVFKQIDNTYKNLKNNPPDNSKIRDHFLNKGIEWEKTFVTKNIAKSDGYKSNKEIKYVRALLGLAELHDYQQLDIKVKIKHEGGTIERFQSPILFKVFGKNIYLLVNKDSTKAIHDQTFSFYIGDTPEKATKIETLKTPTEFNIVEFINNNIR